MAEKKKTYLVPVVYEMSGRVLVEADTAREAAEKVKKNPDEYPLPDDAVYLMDSFQVDEGGIFINENGEMVDIDG